MSTDWKNVNERGNLLGIRFVTQVYRYGGKWLVTPILYIAVFYFFISRSSTRRHSRYYLDRIKRNFHEERYQKLTPWQHYMQFASSLLDRVAIWMNDKGFEHVSIPNQDQFLDVCAKAPGAVVLTAHLGNFELCRALTNDDSGIRANIIMDTGHSRSFGQAIQQIDTGAPVTLIPPEAFTPAKAVELQQKLNEGECLYMMADRVSPTNPGRVIPISFLGGEVKLPEGTLRIALSFDCPIYFMTCVKTAPDQYELVIEPLNCAPHSSSKKVRMQRLANAYAKRLEALCKQYPLQWFNFYDYWGDETQDHANTNK